MKKQLKNFIKNGLKSRKIKVNRSPMARCYAIGCVVIATRA